MSSITIDLLEGQLAKLTELASHLGISPEELARLSVEEMLSQPDGKFEQAADYVLKKNAELYRRLA
jgi:hypothetical protein